MYLLECILIGMDVIYWRKRSFEGYIDIDKNFLESLSGGGVIFYRKMLIDKCKVMMKIENFYFYNY